MSRRRAAASSASTSPSSSAAPAPSPGAAADASTGGPPAVDDPASPPGSPLGGDAGQTSNEASVGPAAGSLGSLAEASAKQGDDWDAVLAQRAAEISRMGDLGLGLIPDAALAAAHDSADLSGNPEFAAFVRALIETAASKIGVEFDVLVEQISQLRIEMSADASGARIGPVTGGAFIPFYPPGEPMELVELSPWAGLGSIVLFREHGRRFKGEPTTPAIITRLFDDQVANLMVLPDGGDPYPRLAVPFEADFDPAKVGRAWSHLPYRDDVPLVVSDEDLAVEPTDAPDDP